MNSLWRGTRTGGSTERGHENGKKKREGVYRDKEPDAIIKDHITANSQKLHCSDCKPQRRAYFYSTLRRRSATMRTWSLHSSVVVRVDADVLLLGAEGKLAALQGFQLMVGLQVRPAPHPAVDHMGQTLPV